MKHPSSPTNHLLAAALVVTNLWLCAGVWASDVHESEAPATETAINTPPAAPNPSVGEENANKPEKYDVDKIGQRNVGRGLNIYSIQKERAWGEALASAIDSSTKLIADQEVNDYISRLGHKIVGHSDAQVPFTFKVVDSPNLRIVALPGGFVYVDKGLIIEVENEAELAGLMAHEIAHVAARHATRFATRKYAWNVLSIPITYLSGPAALGTNQIGPLTLGRFNRDAEIEADLLGIEYQYAAGYDPQAFIDVLEKLSAKAMRPRRHQEKSSNSRDSTLRHQLARAFAVYPPPDERIRKLQTEVSTFLPGRNDYVVNTSEFEDVKMRLIQTDRPILRRHRGEDPANAPVLNRRTAEPMPQNNLAGNGPFVTKGRITSVFGYLPVFP